MRFKQKTALLLASAMLVGSVGMMNPTEVRAAGEANSFTLIVPADTNITKSGWNDIGSVGVSNVSIASDKKISVTIENGATGRNLVNTTDSNKKVGYEIKKGNAETNEAFGTSLDFTQNGTQAIGADVADFSTAAAGIYEDTINFTATLVNAAATAVTYNRTDGTGTLSTENLGTPTSWTYSGTTYQVYNEFIPSSSGSSWNDAMGFVAALNTAQFDGHGDWTLLSSVSMASAYAASGTGAMPDSSARGDVDFLWSSVEYENAENSAYYLFCDGDDWYRVNKSNAGSRYGFVVLRGSSKSAATAVTYERTGEPALSSENLGTPTSWTYSGTTYQVYNEFIPSSSGSSWNDAMGFVAALNTAQFDGHGDWTLLSSGSMASAYAASGTGAMPDSSARGFVGFLWSSVEGENDEANAYCLNCNGGNWGMGNKSYANSYCGFVVLRGSSKSAATPVTYNRTDGTGTLSTADLGEPTEWEYDGTTYQVYNAFIPSSSGSSWNDAMGFVNALKTANYGGYNDWTLLSSQDMATAYAASENGAMPASSVRGGVFCLWSSVELEYDEDFAYYLYCDSGDWFVDGKLLAASDYGFVVLRGSSKSAATPVTYNRTDGTGTLSTADLGTPTSWTYDGTTYQVYNEFIPSSSGSSWNDAMGFVNALNTANYGGYNDWALLGSQDMATAYAASENGAMPDSSVSGVVFCLWSSVEDEDLENFAYCLGCFGGTWNMTAKSDANSHFGFVVLRGSSKSAATAVTYNRTDGSGTLSTADLGEPTEWTYSGTTYQVYNEFIPSSSGSSWNDAMGFVNALKTANYGGYNDWTLLSSQDMAKAYAASENGAMPDSSVRGGVDCLWSSVELVYDEGQELAYYLYCRNGLSHVDIKWNAASNYGFVVLRGSSN